MNLYLIGYRGSGKSTIAPHLAKKLLWKAVDTDQEIEILCGRTIAEIFSEEGESGFRQWETSVIQGYALEKEHVVSLGGGAPTIEINRRLIKNSGKVVWLTASPEILWERISKDSKSRENRPALTGIDDGLKEVQQMLEQRQETYADCADYTVDTSKLSTDRVIDEIANWFDPVDT
ncbi:MAG: shikimate kinase [Planctomycetota bacterium]